MKLRVQEILSFCVVLPGILSGVVIVIGLPLVRAYARRMENAPPELPSEMSSRLMRMEQAIDSIAVEVERISEGQRFTTKLLAERSGAPVGGDVSPPVR